MPKNRLRRRDFIRGMVGAAARSAKSVYPAHERVSPPPSPGSAPEIQPGVDPWFLRNDPFWVGKLSQPQYEIEFEFNAKQVPMRDGVMLAANVWRPKAQGRFPVIYIHIAYDKSNQLFAVKRAQYFVPRGYAFVAIDCRGRYDSDRVPYFYWHTNWQEGRFEGQDVEDSLKWIGNQKWCSGKIGMTGPSYLGFVCIDRREQNKQY